MRGSHFSRTNCSTAMVVSGRFCLRFLDRRQFAKRVRASLFEIWLTGPRTFERRTLLRVSSGCSSVSRQRATPHLLALPFDSQTSILETETHVPHHLTGGQVAVASGVFPRAGGDKWWIIAAKRSTKREEEQAEKPLYIPKST